MVSSGYLTRPPGLHLGTVCVIERQQIGLVEALHQAARAEYATGRLFHRDVQNTAPRHPRAIYSRTSRSIVFR